MKNVIAAIVFAWAIMGMVHDVQALRQDTSELHTSQPVVTVHMEVKAI